MVSAHKVLFSSAIFGSFCVSLLMSNILPIKSVCVCMCDVSHLRKWTEMSPDGQ